MKTLSIDDVRVVVDDGKFLFVTKTGESFSFSPTEDQREAIEGVEFDKEFNITMTLNDEDCEFMKLKYGAVEVEVGND